MAGLLTAQYYKGIFSIEEPSSMTSQSSLCQVDIKFARTYSYIHIFLPPSAFLYPLPPSNVHNKTCTQTHAQEQQLPHRCKSQMGMPQPATWDPSQRA